MGSLVTTQGTGGWALSRRRRRAFATAFTYSALLVLGLTFALPFLWTLSTSLMTGQETRAVPPQALPEIPQWTNYVRVWAEQPMGVWLRNSALIAVTTVPGAVITSTLVAYAFARFDFPGRGFLFMVMLSTLMLPYEVTLIPQYIIYQKYFGWVNTYWPLIIPSWVGGGAFTIFLIRQFLMTIPRDLDDAARVDGASSLQILWRILVPLCKPALATIAILHFLAGWNDFLGPFVYLNDQALFTMSLGLRFFQSVRGEAVIAEPKENLLMAATVVMSVPVIVLFFSFQRYFVQGIVMSGIKG